MNEVEKEKFEQAVNFEIQGKFIEALECLDYLINARSDFEEAINLKGIVLTKLGKVDDALDTFDHGLKINANYADFYYSKGVVLFKIGQLQQAIGYFKKALTKKPHFAKASNNLGIVFMTLGQTNEALKYFNNSITYDPEFAQAHYNKGYACHNLEKDDQAMVCYDRALEIDPNYSDAWNGKGEILIKKEAYDDALTALNNALINDDKNALALSNRSTVHTSLMSFDQALIDIQASLEIDPNNPDTLYNKGVLLNKLGKHKDALFCYEKSLEIRPNHTQTTWNKSLIDLLLGKWKEGWEGYESRFNRPKNTEKYFFCEGKNWRGLESLTGKTIFIQCEQGYGDTIQFCRFLKPLCDQGADVIISAPQTLFPILERLPLSLIIIKAGEIPEKFDYCCPLMSLPFALGVTVENMETPSSYITSDPNREVPFSHLDKAEKLNVGIVCSGRPTHTNDHNRTLSLSLLKPLFDLDCDFHMLQKEYRDEDLQLLDELPNVEDHCERLNDFSDTAALISKMDLVISVDTSVAHLAGALGKSIWILLPFAPDYRWMLESTNSPWYQSAVLYRQSSIGQWKDVINNLKNDLKHKIVGN